MDYTVAMYLAYLVLSLGLTIWVGQTLFKNGRIFLVDAFHGREPLADSVNHLLLVGFYLLNIGYITFALTSDLRPSDVREVIEILSRKIGLVAIILGALHMGNVLIFRKIRQHETKEKTGQELVQQPRGEVKNG